MAEAGSDLVDGSIVEATIDGIDRGRPIDLVGQEIRGSACIQMYHSGLIIKKERCRCFLTLIFGTACLPPSGIHR
jgi:hypothetical protein